eukprot:669567-Amphidinium_carterae.1
MHPPVTTALTQRLSTYNSSLFWIKKCIPPPPKVHGTCFAASVAMLLTYKGRRADPRKRDRRRT